MTWARCRTKQKLGRVISWNSKTPLWSELLWEHLVQPLFSLHHGDLSQVSGVCKSGHNIAIKHLSFPSHSRSAPTHTHTRASTSCVSQILVKNTQMWAAYRRYNQNTEAHCAATTLHPCFFGWHTHSLPIMLLCTSSFPCTGHWGRPSLSTCRRWSVMRRSYPMRSYFLCPNVVIPLLLLLLQMSSCNRESSWHESLPPVSLSSVSSLLSSWGAEDDKQTESLTLQRLLLLAKVFLLFLDLFKNMFLWGALSLGGFLHGLFHGGENCNHSLQSLFMIHMTASIAGLTDSCCNLPSWRLKAGSKAVPDSLKDEQEERWKTEAAH